jgi:hypothetical protein
MLPPIQKNNESRCGFRSAFASGGNSQNERENIVRKSLPLTTTIDTTTTTIQKIDANENISKQQDFIRPSSEHIMLNLSQKQLKTFQHYCIKEPRFLLLTKIFGKFF